MQRFYQKSFKEKLHILQCNTTQKLKFRINNFFSQREQIRSFLGFGHIY